MRMSIGIIMVRKMRGSLIGPRVIVWVSIWIICSIRLVEVFEVSILIVGLPLTGLKVGAEDGVTSLPCQRIFFHLKVPFWRK